MNATRTTKLGLATAAAALAFGAAACEVEDGGLDPGLEEDPIFDEGLDDEF